MIPISYLYVERNEIDYDKVWTVCTDKNHREGGMASLLINFMLVKQLNEKRNRMLLEVYNDNDISRDNNDVKQKIIMSLFGKKGFVHKQKEDLEEETQNNLLGKNGETKVMVFNPENFLKNNPDEERNLNSNGRKSIFNANNSYNKMNTYNNNPCKTNNSYNTINSYNSTNSDLKPELQYESNKSEDSYDNINPIIDKNNYNYNYNNLQNANTLL